MNWRRGSTTSPIRIVNILSASTALSSLRSTLSSLRFSGFIVVSNNSLAFISPRPLKRLICTPRRPISKIFSRISGIEKSGCVELDQFGAAADAVCFQGRRLCITERQQLLFHLGVEQIEIEVALVKFPD